MPNRIRLRNFADTSDRINPVAAKIVAFPMFSPPNQPGQPFTQNINYSKNAASGGKIPYAWILVSY